MSTPDELFADFPDRLTREQTAQLLGRNIRTIDRWIATGQLPAYRLAGRLFIAKSDLVAMVRPWKATNREEQE